MRAFASLVFPWLGDQVLLCDIDGRGWCIPSGRVEPNETSRQAAVREAKEEAGATLTDFDYMGCYRVSEKNETRWADCFVASVSQIGELTMPEESKGVRLASLDELPAIYHLWNPLTEMVFLHALEIVHRKRRL